MSTIFLRFSPLKADSIRKLLRVSKFSHRSEPRARKLGTPIGVDPYTNGFPPWRVEAPSVEYTVFRPVSGYQGIADSFAPWQWKEGGGIGGGNQYYFPQAINTFAAPTVPAPESPPPEQPAPSSPPTSVSAPSTGVGVDPDVPVTGGFPGGGGFTDVTVPIDIIP